MKKLALLLISALLLSGCNRLDNHQPLSSHPLSFAKVNVIKQTFVAHRNDLNMVYICLKNPARTLVPLRFTLTDDLGLVIRQLDFTGGNIDNFDCTRFQFDPIKDSVLRTYSAAVSVVLDPTLTSKEQESLRSGLYAEAHGGGDYLGGTAYLDGLEVPYDLHFKTLYYQPLKEVFAESAWQFLYRLTQDPLFFLVFLTFIGGVIYQLTKAK